MNTSSPLRLALDTNLIQFQGGISDAQKLAVIAELTRRRQISIRDDARVTYRS